MLIPKTEQDEARYRVALKRILRGIVGRIDSELPTAQLEAHVKEVMPTHPVVVAESIDRWFNEAAKAYERGNNSGNNETMRVEEQNCENSRSVAERVLKLWGVAVDYPGLYPSFKWKGHDYHSVENLLHYVSTSERYGKGQTPDAERVKIGEQIAELFRMKQNREYKDRFETAWGTKTALGVYEVFMRVADEIKEGTFKL